MVNREKVTRGDGALYSGDTDRHARKPLNE